MKKTVLFVLIILFAFFSLHKAEAFQSRVWVVKAYFSSLAYLKNCGHKPSDYTIQLRSIGKTFWTTYCFPKFMKPCSPWRFLIDARGAGKEMNIENLNVVFRDDYPGPMVSLKEKEKLMKEYLNLVSGNEVHAYYSGYPMKIIGGISDIPKYEVSPLDEDVASVIRPPFVIDDSIYVKYVYQQIGGEVARVRFVFKKNVFQACEYMLLGKSIGEAIYFI